MQCDRIVVCVDLPGGFCSTRQHGHLDWRLFLNGHALQEWAKQRGILRPIHILPCTYNTGYGRISPAPPSALFRPARGVHKTRQGKKAIASLERRRGSKRRRTAHRPHRVTGSLSKSANQIRTSKCPRCGSREVLRRRCEIQSRQIHAYDDAIALYRTVARGVGNGIRGLHDRGCS
jgi:hypothetical protein